MQVTSALPAAIALANNDKVLLYTTHGSSVSWLRHLFPNFIFCVRWTCAHLVQMSPASCCVLQIMRQPLNIVTILRIAKVLRPMRTVSRIGGVRTVSKQTHLMRVPTPEPVWTLPHLTLAQAPQNHKHIPARAQTWTLFLIFRDSDLPQVMEALIDSLPSVLFTCLIYVVVMAMFASLFMSWLTGKRMDYRCEISGKLIGCIRHYFYLQLRHDIRYLTVKRDWLITVRGKLP